MIAKTELYNKINFKNIVSNFLAKADRKESPTSTFFCVCVCRIYEKFQELLQRSCSRNEQRKKFTHFLQLKRLNPKPLQQ